MLFYEGKLKGLAYEFFFKFSRFEFALKEKGFVMSGRNNSAQPSWNNFLDRFQNGYILEQFEKEIIDNPPKVQIYEDNTIKWRDFEFRNSPSDMKKISLLLRAIRNNLFHGGKHGNSDWDDKDRVEFLLTRGCQCIDKMAIVDDDLRAHYEDTY